MDAEASHAQPGTDAECSGLMMVEISNAMVHLYKELFGRGPTKARTDYAGPDLLVSTLENSLTRIESTMVAAGEHERTSGSPGWRRGDLQKLIVASGLMPVPDLFHVTAEPLEDGIIVRATGEIDVTTIDVLRRELGTAREEATTVLLDLSGVTFIDSTGLHLLLEASHSSALSDWGFFVTRPSRVVQRLIEVSGTADLLKIVDPSAERVVA
jgi:anti-anti-sigma factor